MKSPRKLIVKERIAIISRQIGLLLFLQVKKRRTILSVPLTLLDKKIIRALFFLISLIAGILLWHIDEVKPIVLAGNAQSISYEGGSKPEISLTVEKPKNPKTAISLKKTAIGVPGPILSETRIVNGRNVCIKNNDKPRKSKKTNKIHVDSECCLDPDEIPNSLCYYAPEKYGKLLSKYLKKR